MTSIKPQVAETAVRALLWQEFGTPPSHLTVVGGGQIAQTYGFAAAGQEYIIRFNRDNMLVNFEKEAYVARRFGSARVPIPPVFRVGRLETLHYIITQKMPGRPLTALPLGENNTLIPALITTLDAIHASDVADTTGYGVFDGQGTGFAASWRGWLARIREEEDPRDFYGHWHHLFDDTFLERPVWERVYAEMIRLLDVCPEERRLVHGGYGFGNVLVQGGRVTAVLDWLDAKYGDFVYDIAWLDFWGPALGYADRFAAYYAAHGREAPHYRERLRCYRCYIALDALRFFAKAGKQDEYRWTRDGILALLG
jgi:hygromycin-B 4-O-kinase